jgi:hypothetical protein
MPTTISGNTGVSQVQDGVITATDLNGAQTGDAPIYGCRAWVNFDGTKDTTGATSTANTNRLILGSGNVTSVLRNSIGNYTVNFTTAMPDADYALVGSADEAGSGSVVTLSLEAFLVGSAQILVTRSGVGRYDTPIITASIFR